MYNKMELFDLKNLELNSTNEIIKYNEKTEEKGLRLSRDQAMEIVQKRAYELKNNGRFEFGKAIIGKIIDAFYDSPYIYDFNYSNVLCSLIEIFYYYKNETLDCLCDDELIEYMKEFFNGTCGGSIELLATRELEQLAREIRESHYNCDELI